MTKTITLIEGDGIGPEITAQVVRVLNAAGAPLSFDRQSLGQKAWEQTGSLIPEATLQSIRRNQVYHADRQGLPQRKRRIAAGV